MFIYKITNLITGKIYIGQTLQSIEVRWKQHQQKRSDCRFLKNAIEKYGINNFKIEEIDGANSQSELNYKEWLWIHRLNCLAPNGYNLKEGGSHGRPTELTRLKRSISLKGLIRGPQNIDHTEKIASQLRGRKQKPEDIEKRASKCRVQIIDTTTNKVYNSIREAAQDLNCFPANISANLAGKSKHCRHRVFKYV